MNIQVKEEIPGVAAARHVEGKLHSLGIKDIQLLFDKQVKMWAVVQVQRPSGSILLPTSYWQGGIRPYILWWCKDEMGRFRVPNDNDIHDAIVTVQRAHKTWEKGGDWLADKFDDQSRAKDEKHRQKLKKKVKEIAPDMKRAIRKGNF